MAEDRWNDSRYRRDEPLWGDDRRRERDREREREMDEQRYRARGAEQRGREEPHDDQPYRPFGDTGPIYTRSGAYGPEGRPYGSRDRSYGPSGRYEDMSPGYRDFEADQRRRHAGDYQPDAYIPNPRDGRGEHDGRSWWDRTQDEMAAWFGDENARRRREWDHRMHQSDRPQEGRSWDERQAGGGLMGEHRGRGPKGYRRSDSRIAEDINDRLTEDPRLDASEIEVRVQDGEATLSGLVFRREDKRRAEDIAEQVSGVTHVQNNLRLRPSEGGDLNRSTGDITL